MLQKHEEAREGRMQVNFGRGILPAIKTGPLIRYSPIRPPLISPSTDLNRDMSCSPTLNYYSQVLLAKSH